MAKCQLHPNEEAHFAWQPFGPEEDYRQAIVEAGSFYRGFPVIKIGNTAFDEISHGTDTVRFDYKAVDYAAHDGIVETYAEYIAAAIKHHDEVLDEFLGRSKTK